MYDSYADVLESYMIAEEGIMDKIKSAGKVIFETVRKVLRAIKEGLLKIVNKLKSLGKKDSNNNTNSTTKNTSNPREEEMRLKQENEELKRQYNYNLRKLLSRETGYINENINLKSKLNSAENDKRELNYSLKNRDAKIKELKDQISENNAKIEELTKSKNQTSSSNSFNFANELNKELARFVSIVTVQNNKACMALPKIINKIKSSTNISEDEYYDIYDMIENSLKIGGWDESYKKLKYSYLPKIKENDYSLIGDLYLKRTCSEFVKQTTTIIDHLEKTVSQFEDIYNNSSSDYQKKLSKITISSLTKEEGTIYLLQLSVSLVNSILKA